MLMINIIIQPYVSFLFTMSYFFEYWIWPFLVHIDITIMVRALALMVLKSYITIFNNTNNKIHATSVVP